MRTRPEQGDAAARCGRPWRSSASLCLVAAALGIAAFIAMPGCLNPRPEELPSTLETVAIVPGSDDGPVRESCGDNPYLAGCAPADPIAGESGNSTPVPPSPAAASPSFGDVGDAGDGAEADAGTLSDPEADSRSDAGL